MPRFHVQHEETRHACSVLLPHAMIVVTYESKRLDCQSLLLRNMSEYEIELGRYQDSYQHAVQSFEASLEAHGDLSIETLQRKIQITRALTRLGKSDEARKLMDEAKNEIECIRKANKEGELDAAYNSTSDILNLAEENSRHAAIQHFLDQYQAYLEMPMLIRYLATEAEVALIDGKCEESERLFRQALRRSTEFFGEDHPENFTYMNKVGQSLKMQKRSAEAVQLYRQAIRGRQSIYGMEHPLTMECYRELALALCHEGALVEAEVLGRRVVDYSLRTFGMKSMHTASAMFVLSNIVGELGNLDEAIELSLMVGLIQDTPANDNSTRAWKYLARGNPSEAEQMLCKAVEKL